MTNSELTLIKDRQNDRDSDYGCPLHDWDDCACHDNDTKALIAEVMRLRAENLEWLAAARQLNNATNNTEEREALIKLSELRIGNTDAYIKGINA